MEESRNDLLVSGLNKGLAEYQRKGEMNLVLDIFSLMCL